MSLINNYKLEVIVNKVSNTLCSANSQKILNLLKEPSLIFIAPLNNSTANDNHDSGLWEIIRLDFMHSFYILQWQACECACMGFCACWSVRACMCVRARYFERVCVGVRVLRVYVRIWVSVGVYDNWCQHETSCLTTHMPPVMVFPFCWQWIWFAKLLEHWTETLAASSQLEDDVSRKICNPLAALTCAERSSAAPKRGLASLAGFLVRSLSNEN